jgi:hypothetical protein
LRTWRAVGREKSAVCHAGFKCLILAGFGAQKLFKKPLASCFAFDIFFAPFRPKDGTDSMIADR